MPKKQVKEEEKVSSMAKMMMKKMKMKKVMMKMAMMQKKMKMNQR